MPTEYYFKEGCFIEEWLNTSDHEDMSIARVRVAAGQTTRLHRLQDTVERYVILSGHAEVCVDGNTRRVSPSDVVIIGSGQSQKISNLEQSDLLFLAICTPRFKEINYQDLEQ